MMEDPSLKQSLRADDSESQLELYTIPRHSSWFRWDDIHEIEKASLKEFFDFSSFTRTPKIYRDYRDFIISKYREDPSRRLTFSDVRKSLVGDVNYLQRVFSFLERWGLINFGLKTASLVEFDDDDFVGEEEEEEEEQRWKVKVEEGPPHGVRVVALPNSLKPVSLPPIACLDGSLPRTDFKMPPLASHTNVFWEVDQLKRKRQVCDNCKGQCESVFYESSKHIWCSTCGLVAYEQHLQNQEESFIICVKCFKNGNYGGNTSADDFKFVDGNLDSAVWTEAETLLLLESVLKHGDDWELVAQSFQTKSKMDCISKLIQLPFGELMLGSAYDRCRYWDTSTKVNSVRPGPVGLAASLDNKRTENQVNNESQWNGDADSEGPPLKKACIAPISDVSSSPMKQANLEDQQILVASTISDETMEIEGEPKNEAQENGDAENQSPHLKNVDPVPISDATSSLMKQVARISTMVGPHITASAAEAAVTALCNENLCPREIFDAELGSATYFNEIERTAQGDDSELYGRPPYSDLTESREITSENSSLPLALRVRAASATALGAAAAHAKILAIQEDREVEHLVATIIETQLKKLNYKMKLVEDLELVMEKEFIQMEELEESFLTERMDVIQRVLDAGISRGRNHIPLKPHRETLS